MADPKFQYVWLVHEGCPDEIGKNLVPPFLSAFGVSPSLLWTSATADRREFVLAVYQRSDQLQ